MLEITPYTLTFRSGSTNSEIFLYVYFICVLCKAIAFLPMELWVCWTLNVEKLEETGDEVLWTGEHVRKGREGDKILVEVLQFTSDLSEMHESGDILPELHGVSRRLGDGCLSKVLAGGSLQVPESFSRQATGDIHLISEHLWEVPDFWKKNP